MYSTKEILETINMVSHQHLDVRTITLGVSLFDCITDDADRTAAKVYDKIMRTAGNLVAVGNAISEEIGIPIVNKRVSVTPVSLITAASRGHMQVIRALDRAAKEIGIDFLGGYSALVHKAMTPYEREFIESIPEALATTEKVCSSVNVATSKAGVNMDAVRLMGSIFKRAAYLTRDQDSIACAKLVVFANAVEDNPFMAGAFLGTGEDDSVVNVGVSGPGVVKVALEEVKGTSHKSPRSSNRPRSRSPASGNWSPPKPLNVSASAAASSTCRSPRPRRSATRSRISSKRSGSKAWARAVPQPRLRCSTTPSKRAASWQAATSEDCPARSSPSPKTQA